MTDKISEKKVERFCDALLIDELVKAKRCLLSGNRCAYTASNKNECRIYQDYYGDRR